MRRRLPAILFAVLVVLSAVPASAAEPDPSATPETTPVVDPTPVIDPTPAPEASPAESVAGEDTPASEPSPAIEPAPPPADGPDATAEPGPVESPAATETPTATATPTADPTAPSPAADPGANGGLDVTGDYIVVLEPTADTAAVVDEHVAEDGIDAGREFTKAVRAFTASDLDAAQKAALLDDPEVVAVVPDEIIHITAQTIPTGVSRVGAKSSSVAAIDGSDQRVDADVAIVDTGIWPHPDLNIAGGYNCSTSNRANWADANGHGTHVAGTVGALDNDFGVVGVAPGVRLWAVRILNADGYGKLSWYVCGLDWIAAQRDPNDASRPMIEAVNMSVAKDGKDDGNCGNSNKDILHQAICRVAKSGITVVAAAANDSGSATRRVPAAYNEVITVSALADTDGKPGAKGGNRCYSWGGYDKDDTFADFSNYGYDVDLIAPGKCIWSTKPGPTYGYSSGTSMAAPAVTGAVALYKASRPRATTAEVKEALQYLGNLNWKTSTDPDSRHEKLLDVSRLGPQGSYSVRAGTPAVLGEQGGVTRIPLTLSRSGTFFERVKFRVSGLPAGWTATFGSTSLIGWTANTTTLSVKVPDPTPAGSYTLTISATNQGRTDTDTATVVVENDKPTAKVARAAVTGGTVGATTVPVRISWTAASDPSTSIAGYELQIRRDGGAWGASIPLRSSVRSITRTFVVGARYETRIRARDAVGNWSSWVQSTAPTRVVVVDDRSSAVGYSGSWVRTASSAAINDTLRRSSSVGAVASYAFTGRGISLVVPTGPGRAKVAIYIDGVYRKTVNLRASSTHHRRVVFTKTFTGSGSHRITLKIVSAGKVQVDAFLVAK